MKKVSDRRYKRIDAGHGSLNGRASQDVGIPAGKIWRVLQPDAGEFPPP